MQEKTETKDICGFCGAAAAKKCSACRQISYCSKEHQKEHWKNHKSNCKPFVITTNGEKGRRLIASRDIKRNDVLMKEEPLIIGPKFMSPEPICLGCYNPIASISSSPKCSKCRWPVCDVRCPGIPKEHNLECEILAAENKRERKVYRYELITPLRCLLQKKHNPQKWMVISEMESHLEQRSTETEIYREVQELYSYLKNHILKNLKKEDDISQETFHRICGILDINGSDVPFGSVELSALYPTFMLMGHSCLPNAKISFNKLQIVIKAAKSIDVNENISTMYTNLLWGTQMRQQYLQSTKYFTCTCPRCKDPTELGTHFSSIRCLQDNCNGYLVPKNPLTIDSLWHCINCFVIMPSSDINEIISRLTYEVDQILEQKQPKVKDVEALLQRLLSVLHSCHYNCFSVKHSLIQLYGHQTGYQYANLDSIHLNKKIEYCRELLSVLSTLDSTGSRTPVYIAVTKYELSAAILETMRRVFLETVNLSLIQESGKEAKQLLIESVMLLNEEKGADMSFQLIQSCKSLYKEVDDIVSGQYFTDF